MRHVAECTYRSLIPRHRGTFTLAAGCFLSNSAATALPLLSARRHLTSFKGETREFMDRVKGEELAVVYFYTTWCKPCSCITAKLETLEGSEQSNTQNGMVEGELPCSSSSQGSSVGSSVVGGAAAASKSREHLEEARNGVGEACLQMLKNGKTVRIIPIDTDESPKLGALHDIRSVPTFVIYRDGRIVGRVEGSGERQLLQLVKNLLHGDGQDGPSDENRTPQQVGGI